MSYEYTEITTSSDGEQFYSVISDNHRNTICHVSNSGKGESNTYVWANPEARDLMIENAEQDYPDNAEPLDRFVDELAIQSKMQ
jgi:hypothetical protein